MKFERIALKKQLETLVFDEYSNRRESLLRILTNTIFYREFTSGIIDGFDFAIIFNRAPVHVSLMSCHEIGIIIVDRYASAILPSGDGEGEGSVSREAKRAALSGC